MFLTGLSWLVGDMSKQNAIDWTKNILIALGLAFLIRWPITEPYKIPSQSMYPTLNGVDRFLKGDRVFVNKFKYGVRVPFMNKRLWHGDEPQRWDVVVFQSPDPNAQHSTLIKRIVGLPGERIHIAHGKVYANGQALTLPADMPPVHYTSPGERIHIADGKAYIGTDVLTGPPDQIPARDVTIPRDDMLFGILEDDAHAVVPAGHYLMLGDNSSNSRDGRYFGWVPNENIVGKAYCIWWPIPRCRDFTGFTKTWWWRTALAILSVFVLWRLFIGRSWAVRNDAVADTVVAGEHVYVNRTALGVPVPFTRMRLTAGRALRRGEVVVYHGPVSDSTGESIYLGRVAGLPGERVYLDNGSIMINGAPLAADDPLAGRVFASDDGAGPYGKSKGKEYSEAPENHYFILCDNFDESEDSRSLGWVSRRDVIGPVTSVWWPLGNRRKI